MAMRVMRFKDWQKASAAALGKPSYSKLTGTSPGGVAAALGVSRQAVHKAIHRNDLDALMVKDDRGEVMFVLVLEDSVSAFRERREARATA